MPDAKIDIIVRYFETQYPPCKASRFYDYEMPLMSVRPSLESLTTGLTRKQRELLTPEMWAEIKCPVLIMNVRLPLCVSDRYEREVYRGIKKTLPSRLSRLRSPSSRQLLTPQAAQSYISSKVCSLP